MTFKVIFTVVILVCIIHAMNCVPGVKYSRGSKNQTPPGETETPAGYGGTETVPGNNGTEIVPGNNCNCTQTVPGNNGTQTVPGNNGTQTVPGNNGTQTVPGNNGTVNGNCPPGSGAGLLSMILTLLLNLVGIINDSELRQTGDDFLAG